MAPLPAASGKLQQETGHGKYVKASERLARGSAGGFRVRD